METLENALINLANNSGFEIYNVGMISSKKEEILVERKKLIAEHKVYEADTRYPYQRSLEFMSNEERKEFEESIKQKQTDNLSFSTKIKKTRSCIP